MPLVWRWVGLPVILNDGMGSHVAHLVHGKAPAPRGSQFQSAFASNQLARSTTTWRIVPVKGNSLS